MARGWESKSVEAQQAEATEKPGKDRVKLTPEAAARSRERENLRLARQRVLQQLEKSGNPRHRKLLEETLADLDQKLSRFEG
jgi:DNA-directed RNA polymerase alpha subunit